MFIFENKKLIVMNYSRLIILNDQEVIFAMKSYQLIIRGQDLYVSFFEKLEVHLCGVITKVEINYDKA